MTAFDRRLEAQQLEATEAPKIVGAAREILEKLPAGFAVNYGNGSTLEVRSHGSRVSVQCKDSSGVLQWEMLGNGDSSYARVALNEAVQDSAWGGIARTLPSVADVLQRSVFSQSYKPLCDAGDLTLPDRTVPRTPDDLTPNNARAALENLIVSPGGSKTYQVLNLQPPAQKSLTLRVDRTSDVLIVELDHNGPRNDSFSGQIIEIPSTREHPIRFFPNHDDSLTVRAYGAAAIDVLKSWMSRCGITSIEASK